jgi:multisubunit Na+/H+ antiporter MnhB subunit
VLRHTPIVAVAGLLTVLAVGFFPVLLGDPPLSHEPGPNEHVVKIGTLELITPVLFDVGLFFLVAGVLIVLVHHLARLVEEDEA